MEAPDQELSLGSKEQTHIVKGKRTKRQRPQSPIPFSFTVNSSSKDGDNNNGGDCYNGEKRYKDENYNSNFSPTTCSNEIQDSTEEEEDMANCLILLAQGRSRESHKHLEEENVPMNYKFNSRRFMETNANGSGKAGYYVYECKTCNRTFPSFQALGGHRASHKKPKGAAVMADMVDLEKKQFLLSSDEEESPFKKTHNYNNNGYPLSSQLNSRGNLYSNNKGKVHECSICGAEFTSGQALGGHMRRHRAPIGTNTSTTLSLTPMTLEPDDQNQPKKQKNLLSLELDLNLPAPEDDHRESKFSFSSKQQQQQQQHKQQQQPQPQPQPQGGLVFSAPALVDCHY
ncbi:zinc finger protein ZAT5 [Quillaja saponaria]|uniref:Zinc finger protein ZAT5 n=1 Tax=Quillaja saponaria TaxID=32244 RepID=A0AAD7M6D2_QUISA|nr:zinc finger protein ZAT5 [Quillaja saponaria]